LSADTGVAGRCRGTLRETERAQHTTRLWWKNQERSLRVIHRRGDTRRRVQCVLRPAARKSSEPRQRRRGLRGRQAFGASAGKFCRNQKAGMAHDSRDGFGSIRREIHGKKTQTRCSRGRSEGNTARDPRPAAAPAGRAKKKTTGAALREKARIPLRHTAGELKNEGAAARVRRTRANRRTQQRFDNLVVAARYLEGKEPGCHSNPSAALNESRTGPGLNAGWRTKGQ
jgi:hypothetical protein